LSEDFTIEGIDFDKGDFVEFDEEGKITVAKK